MAGSSKNVIQEWAFSVLESTFFPEIMSYRLLSALYITHLRRIPNLITDDQVYIDRCSKGRRFCFRCFRQHKQGFEACHFSFCWSNALTQSPADWEQRRQCSVKLLASRKGWLGINRVLQMSAWILLPLVPCLQISGGSDSWVTKAIWGRFAVFKNRAQLSGMIPLHLMAWQQSALSLPCSCTGDPAKWSMLQLHRGHPPPFLLRIILGNFWIVFFSYT